MMFEGQDAELMAFVNVLGISIMVLVVVFHFVTARAKDADAN